VARNLALHAVALGLGLIVAGEALSADVYTATANFKNAKGEPASIPVTITVEQTTPEAEREALFAKVKDDPKVTKQLLAEHKAIGFIEARDVRVPIKYAYVYPGGSGEFITVISDEPLGFIGGDRTFAKSKEGWELTYANLQMNAAGKGRGELAPACKVKFMKSGAPAVEDYGREVVWLDDVVKASQP
jgi:hypothetical protein